MEFLWTILAKKKNRFDLQQPAMSQWGVGGGVGGVGVGGGGMGPRV